MPILLKCFETFIIIIIIIIIIINITIFITTIISIILIIIIILCNVAGAGNETQISWLCKFIRLYNEKFYQ